MKKILLFTSLILAFGLTTISFGQAQVESGGWGVNSSSGKYTLNKNSGDRSMLVDVVFDVPFDERPDVMIAVSTYDGDGSVNTRFSVTPVSISRDGFTIKVETWSDSKINAIGGYWVAHAKKTMKRDKSDY